MRTIKFLLVILFGIAASACGGGSSSSGSTTPSTFDISGTVVGAPAVTILQTGAANQTTTTDITENYSLTGLANGSYSVRPTLGGYVFSPASVAVKVNGASVPNTNFTATASTAATYSLSGTVSGAVVQNVVVSLNGANTGSTLTDANGNYSFSGLLSGSYTVTAALSGYSFSSIIPAGSTTGSISIVSANSTSNNSVAVAAPSGSNLLFIPVVTLPAATTGAAYSSTVIGSISGGTPPYHYQSDSFATGAPPMGMIVDLNGNLTGTPSVARTYSFGVCAVDMVGASSCGTSAITVNPTLPLTGTWAGTWSWAGPGSNGCAFSDGGAFSMTVTQTGTTFSGTTTAAGVETRQDVTCALMSTNTVSGNASGNISGAAVNLTLDLYGSVSTLSFSGTATLNANTLTGSITRTTGGTGNLNLTRQ